MLKILKNPKTQNYITLKENILSNDFSWYYQSTSTYEVQADKGHENLPFYSHVLLTRPDTEKDPYCEIRSEKFEFTQNVVHEIISSNQNPFDDGSGRFFFMRMCINSTFPIEGGNQFCIPHSEHAFPHFNFICYLTDGHGGGRTFIEEHPPVSPVEDQCIIFTGKHYAELPKKGRRIIIVGTMVTY